MSFVVQGYQLSEYETLLFVPCLTEKAGHNQVNPVCSPLLCACPQSLMASAYACATLALSCSCVALPPACLAFALARTCVLGASSLYSSFPA